MKILIACEHSGTVRDAFRRRGHLAVSCDLLPDESDSPSFHRQGDVLDMLSEGWDLLIAHPPCTHLASSGSLTPGSKNTLNGLMTSHRIRPYTSLLPAVLSAFGPSSSSLPGIDSVDFLMECEGS